MIIKRITSFLDKFKYFGLRFLYYRFIELFPYFSYRLRDYCYPTIQSKSLSTRLIREYGGLMGHGVVESSSNLGLGLLHYSLIRVMRPKRILCVGSYRGFIPVICALACRDNNYGKVDFVDVGIDGGEGKEFLGDGFWKRVDADKHFSKVVSPIFIRTHVMTSLEFAKKFPNRRYQYIYIDGDHTYDGVKSDYDLFWPMLDDKGYMSFHDISGQSTTDVDIGVGKLWDEIEDKNKIAIPYPKEDGLGMIQKV